jgi:antitoxin component of MazEF toxin-antitoxin module
LPHAVRVDIIKYNDNLEIPQMTVTLKKLGGSIALVIPKALANEMELTAGTTLDVTMTAGGMVLKKQGRRPRRPLSQIVAGMNPASYRRLRREMSGDRPVGKEVW